MRFVYGELSCLWVNFILVFFDMLVENMYLWLFVFMVVILIVYVFWCGLISECFFVFFDIVVIVENVILFLFYDFSNEMFIINFINVMVRGEVNFVVGF